MDIQSRYEKVLKELANHGRALQRYTPEDIEELSRALLECEEEKAEQVLCLINHAAYPHSEFEKPLLMFLRRKDLPAEHIVYGLNGARKHIIQARFKVGDRLELEFLELLRTLLQHSRDEVVEWCLRTIEECGNQSILLAQDVMRKRPSVFSLWRAQSRTILELVTLLQRRWDQPREAEKRRVSTQSELGD